MLDLIYKRHAGESWIVFTELANATGANVSRHADAAALGLWPSRGHELHGYELKISRSDVQRELDDPRKADAVGKYCDFWWLVVGDLKIIDGLVIPSTWGVLYPKNQVLRVHKKAPKLKPKDLTRGFVAAMIRNMAKSWVPKTDYTALMERQHQEVQAELEKERKWRKDDDQAERQRLEQRIKAFEEASGVTIDHWNAGNVGAAVRFVLDSRTANGKDEVRRSIHRLEQSAHQHENLAAVARQSVERLREFLNPQDQQELVLDDPMTSGLRGLRHG